MVLTKHLEDRGLMHAMDSISVRFSASAFESSTIKLDPNQVLPVEIFLYILHFLKDPAALERCCLINKNWKKIADDRSLWIAFRPTDAFGTNEYLKFLKVDVGEEPLLPRNIHLIRQRLCPFSNDGKTVQETQLLLLIPKTINGKPSYFKELQPLLKSLLSEKGIELCFRYLSYEEMSCGIDASHWILLTKTILPGSLNIDYECQSKLVETLGNQMYQVTSVFALVSGMLAEYARSKTRLFGDLPRVYALCKDSVYEDPVAVGCFTFNGFSVFRINYPEENYGIAAMRRLPSSAV